MLSYSQYSDIVDDAVSHLDIPATPAGLYDPIRYILQAGGKRLRPVLAIAAAHACGAEPEAAINQAMAMEVFHNFTLLHDDVMDHADMRRGRPTVHIKWDESTAILSGDAMLTFATILAGRCSASHLPAVMKLFNTTAIEVYEGQQYDVDFEKRLDVTEQEYIEMIRLKTSVLLGAACRMGAIIADASEETAAALYRYGEQMGLAFQLRDDLLDTYGDPIVFGKRVGGDILNDKKTWLLIKALEGDDTGELKRIIVEHRLDADDKIAAVKKIYEACDVAARCEELISRYSDDAIATINATSLRPSAKEFFASLAKRAAGRSN